jgi:hypothetical protein
MADERYQLTGEYKGQTYVLVSTNNKDEAEGVARSEEPKGYYENLTVVDTQVKTKDEEEPDKEPDDGSKAKTSGGRKTGGSL